MKLQDKVCIVTGAASGIGKEIAITYAREGGKVVIADLNKDAAQATADEIIKSGGKARAVAMDVTNEDQVNTAVAEVVAAWGGVKLLRERFHVEPRVVTGPATDNAVGVDIIQGQLKVPAFNALSNGAALGDSIIASIGLAERFPVSATS